jgi:hypothetical protein
MICTCSPAQLHLVGCDCEVDHQNDPYVFVRNTGEVIVDRYPSHVAPYAARIASLGAVGALMLDHVEHDEPVITRRQGPLGLSVARCEA